MCGIAGFVGPGDVSDLKAMLSAIVHRGPDGEGIYVDRSVAVHLGHRRLAIIDLAGGVQPMWNEDGHVGVVFNGEIYNHMELRAQLSHRGHVFRSDHSDTEVLIHGYEEWGSGLVERLNGMFAFAIYDRTRHEIFLARDRFGEKPLYYTHQKGLFAFGSELSALLQHRCIEDVIATAALQKFLAYGFLPAPTTLRSRIFKIPGGCHLTYDIQFGQTKLARYWDFTLDPQPSQEGASNEKLAEELRHLLFQATQRRLISDVPLGIFLSGGIDSSSVLAAAASGVAPGQLQTFTLGFTEASFDESAVAAETAHSFKTIHNTTKLDLDAAGSLIPPVLSMMDEPLGDASIIPTYLLSRFTRQRVTVALSGDGGDELFAGYDPFKALTPAVWYSRLVPRGLHRELRRLADLLPISDRNMSLDFKLRRALTGLEYAPAMWNPIWLSAAEPALISALFEEPIAAEDLYSEAISAWQREPRLSTAERTLEFYTRFYLQDDILMKADRAAMMNSLESRAVFLDNDLVDFCRRLPLKFKYHRGESKILLKQALRGILPEAILSRRKKGFGIPLAKWLRTIPNTVPLQPLAGVRLRAMEQAWNAHRAGSVDHRLLLWSWLALQFLPRDHASGRPSAVTACAQ